MKLFGLFSFFHRNKNSNITAYCFLFNLLNLAIFCVLATNEVKKNLYVIPSINHNLTEARSTLHVEIITFAMMPPTTLGGLAYVGPGFDIADEDWRRDYPNLKLTHTYFYQPKIKICTEWAMESDQITAEYINRRNVTPDVTALILPGCSEMLSLGALAVEWDMILISIVMGHPVLPNGYVSPTWLTTSVLSSLVYQMLYVNVLKTFNWSSVFIVADMGVNAFFYAVGSALPKWLKTVPRIQTELLLIDTSKNTIRFFEILTKFTQISRDLRITYEYDKRRVYIALTPYRGEFSGNFSWNYNDSNDNIAREAYRSLLLLEPEESLGGSADLMEAAKRRSLKDYNFTYGASETVSPHIVSAYAAVMMLGQVINETFERNKSFNFSQGKTLAKLFFNRTFELRTGKLYLSDVGERLPEFHVKDFNYISGQFETVMIQHPDRFSLELVAKIDWPGGKGPILNEPLCGFKGNSLACQKIISDTVVIAATAGIIVLLVAAIILAIYRIRKNSFESALHEMWWHLYPEEIVFDRSMCASNYQLNNPLSVQKIMAAKSIAAAYRSDNVWMTPLGKSPKNVLASVGRQSLLSLKEIHETLSDNINRLVGLYYDPSSEKLYFIAPLCAKGSIENLISTINLDWDLQVSLMMDLLLGMRVISQSSIKVHGDLTSSKCLIDGRFTLKVTKLGFYTLQKLLCFDAKDNQPEQNFRDIHDRRLFWRAPEILKKDGSGCSAATDIYSVAVILNEILTLVQPYEKNIKNHCSVHDVLDKITSESKTPFRPMTSEDPNLAGLVTVIKQCWHKDPQLRPSVSTALKSVENRLRESGYRRYAKRHVVENIMNRLERYADELDKQVDERTEALLLEQRKCDDLLREMLPSLIVNQLRSGEKSAAEMFESVTILFSCVSGFASFLQEMNPADVLHFLDKMYTLFDHILGQFDVYKVETIADSYVVASGLPIRNGNDHVRQISSFAILLMSSYQLLSHSADAFLRIGIHTGPCAAGVVGQKAPRYCVFGDTINTASRMLTHGVDSRIHLSLSTVSILKLFPAFVVTERQMMEIKGKGHMLTFWLDGQTTAPKQ